MTTITITLSGAGFPPTVSTSPALSVMEETGNLTYNLTDNTGTGYKFIAAGGWYSSPAPGSTETSPLQVNSTTLPKLTPPAQPSAGTMVSITATDSCVISDTVPGSGSDIDHSFYFQYSDESGEHVFYHDPQISNRPPA